MQFQIKQTSETFIPFEITDGAYSFVEYSTKKYIIVKGENSLKIRPYTTGPFLLIDTLDQKTAELIYSGQSCDMDEALEELDKAINQFNSFRPGFAFNIAMTHEELQSDVQQPKIIAHISEDATIEHF